MMKKLTILMLSLLLLVMLTSCGSATRRSRKPYDAYLYKRGAWSTSKGGLFDDVPQFFWQMLESMFDYGAQPVDPPSEYAPRKMGVMNHAERAG